MPIGLALLSLLRSDCRRSIQRGELTLTCSKPTFIQSGADAPNVSEALDSSRRGYTAAYPSGTTCPCQVDRQLAAHSCASHLRL